MAPWYGHFYKSLAIYCAVSVIAGCSRKDDFLTPTQEPNFISASSVAFAYTNEDQADQDTVTCVSGTDFLVEEKSNAIHALSSPTRVNILMSPGQLCDRNIMLLT